MSAPPPVTAWSWTPPVIWTCLRCSATFLTRDAQPKCPVCGFSETRE